MSEDSDSDLTLQPFGDYLTQVRANAPEIYIDPRIFDLKFSVPFHHHDDPETSHIIPLGNPISSTGGYYNQVVIFPLLPEGGYATYGGAPVDTEALTLGQIYDQIEKHGLSCRVVLRRDYLQNEFNIKKLMENFALQMFLKVDTKLLTYIKGTDSAEINSPAFLNALLEENVHCVGSPFKCVKVPMQKVLSSINKRYISDALMDYVLDHREDSAIIIVDEAMLKEAFSRDQSHTEVTLGAVIDEVDEINGEVTGFYLVDGALHIFPLDQLAAMRSNATRPERSGESRTIEPRTRDHPEPY